MERYRILVTFDDSNIKSITLDEFYTEFEYVESRVSDILKNGVWFDHGSKHYVYPPHKINRILIYSNYEEGYEDKG